MPMELIASRSGSKLPGAASTLPTALGLDAYLMWASDYPHYDCEFLGAVGELREHCAALPEDAQRRIIGENAVRCYGLN